MSGNHARHARILPTISRLIPCTFCFFDPLGTHQLYFLIFRMVLVICDQLLKEVPSTTAAIYSTWPALKDSSHALTTMIPEELGSRGLLYLRQREYAVTVSHDENVQILGTDDATTSVMAVLRHTGKYLQRHYDH